jgi:hypothetical protein
MKNDTDGIDNYEEEHKGYASITPPILQNCCMYCSQLLYRLG